MNDNDWTLVSLKEILKQSTERVLVSADSEYPNFGIYSFGRGLFAKLPINGSTSSATALFRAKRHQFVYSRLFAFEGAYGIVPDELDGYLVSNEFPLFDCNNARLVPNYLGWFFRNPPIWSEVARLTSGMGDRRQRIKPEALLTYKIPLPPLQTQARIVERIEQLAQKIREAQQLYGERRAEIQGIIRSTRRQLIGQEPRSDWVSLGQVVIDIENGWSPQCLNHPATDGKWGVLKVGAVSFGSFDPRQNKELPESLKALPQYEVKAGDFLMSRANTVELVGACALVDKTPPRLILCDKIFRFRFGTKSKVEPAFLDHVLKSPALRTQIEAGATGTSPTMRNIAKAKIMNLKIPVPPIEEQQRVVSLLNKLQSRCDELLRSHATTSRELDALLPSILDRAFKGEL